MTVRRDGMNRSDYVKQIGWHIFTNKQAKLIAEIINDSYVIEVFAGTGYTAGLIKKHLVKNKSTGIYRVYDNKVWKFNNHKGVSKKNAFLAPIKKADVIIMAWPQYGTNDAYRIARKMKIGQKLFYEGEGYGGCTGDDEFHEYLESNFERTDVSVEDEVNDEHKRWRGINDYWWFYRKVR